MKFTYNDVGSLVRRVKQNDSQAFTSLYERTYQRLYFLALSILNNEQDAQDAVQETYILILDSLHTLEDETLFIAWAHRITYRLCLRMLKKRRDVPTDNELIADAPDRDIYHEPFTAMVRSEQKNLLSRAVEALEPELRTTILLRYFENMKINEIAIVMNCPTGTVKSRLRVAKKKLLTAMHNDGSLAMFVAMFTMVPLRAVFHESARSAGMSSQAAFGILSSSAAHQGMAVPAAFTSTNSAAVGTGLFVGAQAAGVTVSVAAAVTMTALVLNTSPIKQIITPSSYTKLTASVMVETKGAPAVTALYAVAPDGSRIEGIHRTDGLFEIQVEENGDYIICAVSKDEKATEETVSIRCIDNSAPKIESNSLEDGLLRVVFSDTQSGPDLNTIYGTLSDGTEFKPVSVNTAEQSALFSLPEDNFVFFISDHLGNTSRHEVTLTRTQ